MINFKKLALAAVGAGLLSAGAAQAATYDLTHLGGLNQYQLLTTTQSYTNTFTLPGFNNAAEDITWAKLSFAFADDDPLGDGIQIWKFFIPGDGPENVSIEFDGNVVDLGDVDGSYLLAPLFYSWESVAGSSGSLLLNALQDGSLTYTVSVTSGDTYLKEVNLLAKSDVRRVPDSGSSVALLGLGLLGLAALKRRRK